MAIWTNIKLEEDIFVLNIVNKIHMTLVKNYSSRKVDIIHVGHIGTNIPLDITPSLPYHECYSLSYANTMRTAHDEYVIV